MGDLIRLNTSYVPPKLTFHNKEVGLKINQDKFSNHNCLFACCKYGNASLEARISGGAPKKKVTDVINTHNPSEIRQIGDSILKKIYEQYIQFAKTVTDEMISHIIGKYIHENQISLTKGENDMLILYIRNNLPSLFKDNIIVKHPLFNLLSQKDILIDYTNLRQSSTQNYDQLIAVTRHLSSTWSGSSEFSKNFKLINLGQENVIHPLFVILFGLKLPGFEDLVITQDYFTLVRELAEDIYNKDNMMLLWLRSADPSLLPTLDEDHRNNLNNENLRVQISVMLRELSYFIRTGNFNTSTSKKLLQILSLIYMPDSSFEEENFLHAILATFSFKPTLLSKMNNNREIDFAPTAAYSIQYPISDFTLQNQGAQFFSEVNFKDIGYDPLRKKIIFLYNNAPDEQTLIANLLKTLGNQSIVETNLYDAVPALITRAGILPDIYENIRKTKILLTNGIFIVSVPRYEKRLFGGPDFSFFKGSNFSEGYNLTPIDFALSLNIHSKEYELKAALCYDIIEKEDDLNPVFAAKHSKIGVFALIKTENGWWEYNPQLLLLPKRKEKKLEDIIIKRGLDINSAEAQKIAREFSEGKIENKDLEIGNEEGFDKIKKYACLLFYSEDYDTYLDRIKMALATRNYATC